MTPSRSLLLLGVLVLTGCEEPHPLPGDQVLGTYSFTATRVDGGCEGLKEMAEDAFQFSGTVTRCLPDSTSAPCAAHPNGAFFTRENVDRDAGFDGQLLDVYPITAPITLTACGSERTRIVDGMRVALFSASQATAVGAPFFCPPNALDGGVPAPDDAGITAPGPGPNGFDAPFACGELVDTIINDDFDGGAGRCRTDAGIALPTGTCTVVFKLQGVRL